MKKAYGRMFPPYIDAYYDFEVISKKEFLKKLVANSNEWAAAAIGQLFLHNQLHSFDDLLSTPIYLGYWGGVQYGVFLKKISKDSYLYHNFLDDIKKEVSECLYNDDMDRT